MIEISIIIGTTGEYSDRNEWVVEAYIDNKKAEEKVELLSKLSNNLLVMKNKNYSCWFKNEEKEFEELKKLDHNFEMEYNGTFYYIVKTNLI